MSYYLYYAPAVLTCAAYICNYTLFPYIWQQPDLFLNGKKDSLGRTVLFREGISFLWGIAKNYIMYWGGYEYYNSMHYYFWLFSKFTNITKVLICFCLFFTKAVCTILPNLRNTLENLFLYEKCFKLFSVDLFFF